MVVDVIHAAAELQVGVVGVGAAADGALVEVAFVLPGRFLGVLEVDGLDARRVSGEQKRTLQNKRRILK